MRTVSEEARQNAIAMQFHAYQEEAQKTIRNPDQLEKVLMDIEAKLAAIPALGTQLSELPVVVSMLRSYIKRDYTDIPTGVICAIVATCTYIVAPKDLIPDNISIIGHLDDAAVLAICLKLISADLEAYKAWRSNNYSI